MNFSSLPLAHARFLFGSQYWLYFLDMPPCMITSCSISKRDLGMLVSSMTQMRLLPCEMSSGYWPECRALGYVSYNNESSTIKALADRLKLLFRWNLETFHTFVASDHAHAEVVLQTYFRLSNHQKLVKGDTCTSCFLYQVRQTDYKKYGFEFTWFGNPMSYLMK